MQVNVSSISQAHQVAKDHPNLESILVGGKRYIPLSTTDMQSACESIDHPYSTGEMENTAGVFVRSVFLPKHGYKGTLYRVGVLFGDYF